MNLFPFCFCKRGFFLSQRYGKINRNKYPLKEWIKELDIYGKRKNRRT